MLATLTMWIIDSFQGIDLLATTPSDLAMSLKTETINVEIRNRMVTEHIDIAKGRQQISKLCYLIEI